MRALGVLTLILVGVLLGAAAGAGLGGLLARPDDGLVAAATVMLSVILGAGLGSVAGGLIAWRASEIWRRRLLRIGGPAALIVAGIGGWAAWEMRQASRDPESAYAGLPVFSAALTRGAAADPVLARFVEVDAAARIWRTGLPDGRVCEGRLRASVQARLGEALAAALPLPAACAGGEADTQLIWSDDAGAGRAELTEACLSAHPPVAALARALSMASSMAQSGASCR
ncbi:MAG: hypothetical protein AAF192_09690 [Pseudomonadota bacterium]